MSMSTRPAEGEQIYCMLAMETEKESNSDMDTFKSDQLLVSKEEANVDEKTRLWAAVKEKPSDFTSWTNLLQIVEQKGELGAAREAFDAFFKYYPYCYGYWKKLADLEKTHAGIDSAKQVYERGVAAVSLSIDIWLHYIKFTSSTDTENKEAIRSLYERALSACGLEYRSSKLWDSYLTWEKTNGTPAHVLAVYDRLLATPTQQLQQHFDNFKKFIEECSIADVLSKEIHTELCNEVGSEDEGELEKAVKEKVVERRSTVFEKTKEEVAKRAKFEDALKRPYFHVKPLERIQLKTWKEYLDFEISQGDQNRIIVLFERCMIACALYEEFWSKFASHAECQSTELARSVYSRACTIHLQQKPNIHVSWAQFEEKQGNTEKAREILKNIDSVAPGIVSVRQARVGLEFRQRRFTQVEALYHSFLEDSTLSNEARNFYTWRYAKFAARVLGDHNKAVQVVRDAISQDHSNPVLYLQLLDLETSRIPPSESAVEVIFEEVQASSEMNDISKAMFAQRRVAFLEEFGYEISKLVNAKVELVRLRSQAGKKRTNANIDDTTEGEPLKRAKLDSTSAAAAVSSDQPTSTTTSTAATMATATAAAPPTAAAATLTTPTDPQQQQQWAAYQQQQWGAYAYGQPGYNYAQYYPQYPQTYGQTSTQ